jgi:hypothetical protein
VRAALDASSDISNPAREKLWPRSDFSRQTLDNSNHIGLAQGGYMRTHVLVLLASLLFACGAARAADGFEAVRCGADVPAALIGKHSSNEPVVAIEARRTALGLKDLGGDEISDKLNSSSWMICGKEYMLLVDQHDVIRDVLSVPPHSHAAPEIAASTCRANGRDVSLVVAILDNRDAKPPPHYSPTDDTLLPAKSAWRIDEKNAKFLPLSANGLTCARSGIITTDGGP